MLSHEESFLTTAQSLATLGLSLPGSVLPASSDPLTPSVSLSNRASAVAFVDAGLSDYQTLVDGVSPGTAVYVLDPNGDALSQISQVLAGYSDLDSVSIFSHGSDGALQLGNSRLNTANLMDYAGLLQSWAGALSETADLLFYGCDVAADGIGQSFINQIAALTGADVAASTDLTGSMALGGNWNLEFSTGSIESSDFLSDWAQVAYQNVLATITVTSLADTVVADGFVTLREAIESANGNTAVNADVVPVGAWGPDTIDFNLSGTITLGTQLTLTDSAKTTINGGNAITVSGNNAVRVFQVNSGASASFIGLTITGGNAGDNQGGGILNLGTLTVSNSTISGNSVGANSGGGIYNLGGTLTVLNSTISSNSVGSGNIGQGGGIYNLGGTATVINSTVSGNSALSGGGITSQGTLTVINSTVSGNSALSGGGILNFVTLTVSNSIVAGNTADIPDGAEIYSSTPFTSGGYNLFGDSSKTTAQALFNVTTLSSDILATSDSLTPTALASILAPLANNGGPTQTHALVAGSLAIDSGSNALIPAGVTTDQRGFFTRTVGSTVDIGAFEFGAVLPPPNSPPVARNDSFTTNEDTLLTVLATSTSGLLANDTDADNNPLTAILVTGPSHGTLSLNANGSFTYTPTANFNGTDSFTYRANDGTVNSNTIATVTLNVTPVNDAPALTGTPATLPSGTEDTPYTITQANLLAGFTDVDGDTLSVSGLTANNGSLTNNNNGTYTFAPNANYNGTVNLSYSVIDSKGGSVAATQSFTLAEVNDVPVAVNDSLSAIAVNSGVRTISFASLLGNDSQGPANENTQTLTITGVSNVIGGTAVISGTNILFTPTANYNGPASFTYTVQDNGTTNGLADPKTATATADFLVIRNVGTLGNSAVTFTGTVSNTDSVDYYQFTLGSNTNKFRLTLGNLTANADVFVYQVNADGSKGALAFPYTNRGGTQAESINNQSLTAGTYLIEVIWPTGVGSTPYNLSFNA